MSRTKVKEKGNYTSLPPVCRHDIYRNDINFVEQYSFNLVPANLEILIIWHWRIVVPGLEVLFFTRQSFISERNRSQGHVQEGLQECVCVCVCPSNHRVIS